MQTATRAASSEGVKLQQVQVAQAATCAAGSEKINLRWRRRPHVLHVLREFMCNVVFLVSPCVESIEIEEY